MACSSSRAGLLRAGLLLACASSRTRSAVAQWSVVSPSSTALSDGEPPASFDRRENIVEPKGVSSALGASPALLQTNKFYSNFLFDVPERSAWTLPYLVTVNNDLPFGMYVSHPKFFEGARDESDDRIKWYANSAAKDLILSAQELKTNQEAIMTDFDDAGLSATVQFTSRDAAEGSMTTYLVRGMAYATVMYDNFTPEVSTIHALLLVNGKSASSSSHTSDDGRFVLEFNDGNTWILYSSDPTLEFVYEFTTDAEPRALRAKSTMTGTLRAALVPYDSSSSLFSEAVDLLDEYAESYPTEGSLEVQSRDDDSKRGRYSINWATSGGASGLLHYSLPHQQALLSSSSRTGLYLSSPTKGDMELTTGTTWTFTENDLPDFDWLPGMDAVTSETEMGWVDYYLESEINVPLDNVAGNSVYFGAKHLMAYAQLCLIAEERGRDDLVETCMDQVESGFDFYLKHENGNPLVYDTTWGGVIGSLGLEEDGGGADFYASYYNDHHFHYGYLINAAAVLAHLRPSWATTANKEWVDMLLRDVNNPNEDDEFFPQYRAFDWFSGHSWARGLLYAGDGKDQESTSEDVNFFYAMTMWAIATGNSELERLGRLQTGMVTRSIKEYFLLKDSNTNHPADFVRNKVTGIFFEMKVDYTTWFGDNVEFIHGIQNIPATAITESVRDPEFVRQEWDQRLESVVESATGTWGTILYMSYATVQKHVAFKEMLTTGADDGLLRSWALYWAATRPDCDTYCDHDEVDLDAAPGSAPSPSTPSDDTPSPVVATGTPPSPTPPTSMGGGPHGGTPAEIPGLVEAEEFDTGGEGVGYSDTTPVNIRGEFRSDEGVDIETTNSDGGFAIGYIEPGEFLRYTVDVAADVDAFDFSFLVAAPAGSSGSFRVVAGGTGCDDFTTDLSGLVEVPSTGGWSSYEDLPMFAEGSDGGLPAGSNSIWLCVISRGFNIDSFTMTEANALPPVPSPSTPSPSPSPAGSGDAFGDDPATIPGVVEAEEFDEGGEGIGYSDTTGANFGGAFRTDESVDVGSTDDGYFVGWIESGEYLRYTVDVSTDVDAFDFSFLVAAPGNSGSFRVVTGGTGCDDFATDLSGLVEVPSTGGWDSFAGLSVSGEEGGGGSLPSGVVKIWLCVITAGFNVDSFSMAAASATGADSPTNSSGDDGGEGGGVEGGASGGAVATVPGVIEAEEFDLGGEGVGYSDTTPVNIPGAFRTEEGVDVAIVNNGYTVGWIEPGEFLRYTVGVTQNVGAFDFSFLVAAPAGQRGSFRVVSGGTGCDDFTTDLSGLVEVPSTGGWDNYDSLPVFSEGTGGLSAGPAMIWLCVVSAGFNIDSFTMAATSS